MMNGIPVQSVGVTSQVPGQLRKNRRWHALDSMELGQYKSHAVGSAL